MVKILRNMVKIDKQKCTGCGQCIIKCAEGALKIINGKAEIVSDKYCDGLGACLGECPEGALSIELREAEVFDEEAVEEHLSRPDEHSCECHSTDETVGCTTKFKALFEAIESQEPGEAQWPIKLELINPKAQFLNAKKINLIADCVPAVYEKYHENKSDDDIIIITCPKFTDTNLLAARIEEILVSPKLENVKIIQMEVPCCSKLKFITEQIMKSLENKNIKLQNEIISVKGEKIIEQAC